MSRPSDDPTNPRRRRRALAWLLVAWVLASGAPGLPRARAAESPASAVDEQDLTFLALMFRNRVQEYLEQPDADPRVRAIAEESAGWRGAPGDTVERFRKLAEAFNRMIWGAWDESRQAATVLDLRLAAKLYEPGQEVTAHLSSLWERPERFSHHFLAKLALLDAAGNEVAAAKPAHLHQAPAPGQAKAMTLGIPAGAAPGLYRVRYSLVPHLHDGTDPAPVLEADRTLFVVSELDTRLRKLEAAIAEMAEPTSAAARLALSTVRWYLDTYRQGQRADVPGAYTDHPVFMIAGLQGTGLTSERMEFHRELELAETLAARLGSGSGGDVEGGAAGAAAGTKLGPLAGLEGDLRLAYASPVDGERVPFRIFVPSGFDAAKRHPLVIALHGAGGDENAFMDRYQGLYKKEAQARGYLAVAVNGRGPYTGYRGAAGRDVLDVADLVEELWPVDPERVYLMGHSMGGMGTVLVGFDHADRFAALAPIAGFGQASQLAKAPSMPIFIGQGDRDALVPVEAARAFHRAAAEGGRDVVYVEKAGVDHIVIVDEVMDAVFDFFDARSGDAG